ncbi:tRNA glutamyl-Q(34) synthetase GluQRS [Shewanella livingstonensis]|uniref:Glutamyl-Q tRNA(Asp) synthetase n=1 Tax=Shewanella livingstonensis TaxID=150120 RepID=A0A3G8LYT0_9GAMM|nr:tRNA glutamyl-Q(34) synthetase GluQRS [Shewanella livingstonensis]AZG74597.1 tRNA glutamyl-Q(34) synthetase GluQRS [Shewanella livingstonensis]
MSTNSYIGRFAPSPSGPLHFGSLIAALGSYLRAHNQQGQWLVRIEDIDPPREIPGASDNILRTLDAYGLHWHGTPLFQHQRHQAYQDLIDALIESDEAYYCQCTRKIIQTSGGVYDGRCGQHQPRLTHGAIRIRNHAKVDHFIDQLQGHVVVDKAFAEEDFIIKRSDDLYAYQLAVVLDDTCQGITEVVRGCDLLEASCRQISMFTQLNLTPPNWLHLPLVCTQKGFKLSKQNHAPAIDITHPQASINAALAFLGQPLVDVDSVEVMLKQAVKQFSLNAIPAEKEIILSTINN